MIDVRVQDSPLSVDSCLNGVRDPSAGGIAIFVGTVRNKTQSKTVLRLDFEAYEPMALKEMQKIADDIVERWDAINVYIHHRVGELSVGEIPVIISVATPHRNEAFKACEYAIDTLKETVPIWKKEIFEDGDVWVAAHP